MSEFDSLTELDFDVWGIEAAFRIDEERNAIDRRLREYGILDRAYDRAEEYIDGMITLSGRGRCQATVYRQMDGAGREIGGGVQLNLSHVSELGITSLAVRVPVYMLNEEGAIRPAGGAFDDTDQAEMVAAQGDGLAELARKKSVALTPDLTALESEADELHGLVVIICPARDDL